MITFPGRNVIIHNPVTFEPHQLRYTTLLRLHPFHHAGRNDAISKVWIVGFDFEAAVKLFAFEIYSSTSGTVNDPVSDSPSNRRNA